MLDRITDALLMAGPLGILSAVLLFIVGTLGLVIRSLFKLYLQAQEARVAQASKAQEVAERAVAVIEAMHRPRR